MHRILVIDDNATVADMVTTALGPSYEVVQAASVAVAETSLKGGRFDLILLDIGLPDGDGYRFCAQLRNSSETQAVPIVFLTGRSEVNDKVMGFSLGADDYITKPFSLAELRARLEARLRRGVLPQEKDEVLVKGDLKISIEAQRVFLVGAGGESPLDLTPIEFKLLHYMARHEESVFNREHLIDRVWGGDVHVSPRAIDSHISNLRKKIAASRCSISAVHGVGYKFSRNELAAAVPVKKAG